MKTIQYPDLPIVAEKETILHALSQHSVIIVAGETGSGKTTQLPKMCLEAGYGVNGKIGHTQPRRLATRSIAQRVAKELDSPLGQMVGYKVRFSDKTSDNTRIQLMTDGILLAQTQQDKSLSEYDCLIIDEAHERSLNIDFLLGYLKILLKRRHDLKVIITSATIDVKRFSEFFNHAPCLTIPGRTYPVEVNYLDDVQFESDDPPERIAQTVQMACSRGKGDILIFQSGEKEIRELVEVLERLQLNNTLILPLYARQSSRAQQKVFESYGGRKIIVATNVAETSITVPHIRFVIDAGFVRVSRYNYRNKLQRLPIEPISQASAEQRKGRCGRVGPGICYRLYQQDDLLARPLFTEPEILRVNLAGVILKMLDLGFRPVESFPLIDPLDSRHIKDGFHLLQRLQAVDVYKKITHVGRKLAKIPLDPKLGRMLIAAQQYGCLTEMLIIVSALSIVDPREWPENNKEQAQLVHAQYADEKSDFLFYLNLWHFLFEHKKALSHNKFRLLCRQNYLSYLRVCEWFDIHEQLEETIEELKLVKNQVKAEYSLIHRALLTALLDTIGIKDEKKEYKGARHIQFLLHPSSMLFKKPPQWVMACEIVHTTKTFARTNAAIEPQWIEEVAGELVKRQYYDPHFDPKEGRVVAFEKVSLYGIELVSRRKISYEKIDFKEARDLFIRQALCEEKLQADFDFYQKNHATLQEVQQIEYRIRKHHALLDEYALFEFYDKRIPYDVASVRALKQHLEKDLHSSSLMFRVEDIVRTLLSGPHETLYPTQLKVDDSFYRLEYELDLTSSYDGVTMIVPIEALKMLKEYDFSWLIPGLLDEKIDFALRSLPKKERVRMQSIPASLSPKGTFSQALSDVLKQKYQLDVSAEMLDKIKFPAHLIMHFKIVNDKNEILGRGDNLTELYEQLKQRHDNVFTTGHSLENRECEQWDFGNLPETVQIKKTNLLLTYYPALFDREGKVWIMLLESKALADYHHSRGLTRLALLQMGDSVKYFMKDVFQKQKKVIIKAFSPFGTPEHFLDELLCLTSFNVFIKHNSRCKTQQEFNQIIQQHRHNFLKTLNQYYHLLMKILDDFACLQKRLHQKNTLVKDIDIQLKALFPYHFISRTPVEWLLRYPIYLKAIGVRLEKFPSRQLKDQQWSKEIEGVQKKYKSKIASIDISTRLPDDPLLVFAFRIEELRVSLFAESLKTIESVSAPRLLKLLEKLG